MLADLPGFAAVVVALGGAIGAILAGIRALRGDRFRREVEESTALLSGYSDMVAALRVELDNVRSALAIERTSWNQERRQLHGEMDELRDKMDDERAEWNAERQKMHAEVEELRQKVGQLSRRLPSTGPQKGK